MVARVVPQSARRHAESRKPDLGFVFAQEGPAELNFPPKIFIGLIYSNYGAHEHLGGAFSNFG